MQLPFRSISFFIELVGLHFIIKVQLKPNYEKENLLPAVIISTNNYIQTFLTKYRHQHNRQPARYQRHAGCKQHQTWFFNAEDEYCAG